MLRQTCIFILIAITFAISTIHAQKYHNQYYFKSFPTHDIKQNTSRVDESYLISSFINSQYQTKQKINGGINKIDSITVNSVSGAKVKLKFIYDGTGQISSYKASFSQVDSYRDVWQNIYAYDSIGKLLSVLITSWDGEKWNNFGRDDFTYNSEGEKILQLDQFWQDSKWENFFRVITSYNNDENLVISIREKWGDSIWVNENKSTVEYFLDSLESASLFQVWQNNRWEDSRFLNFEYDNENKVASITAYDWNGITWESIFKTILNYSPATSKITRLVEIWENNKWIDYFRNSETYTVNNLFKQGVFEYYENGEWFQADGPISLYNPDGFELHYIAHEMIVYYNETTSIKVEDTNNVNGFELFQNYPNPFNPSTTISFRIPSNSFVTLKVYDVLSNEVAVLVNEWKEAGSYSTQFTTSSAYGGKQLASGMYFYTLTAGKFTDTKKFILLK